MAEYNPIAFSTLSTFLEAKGFTARTINRRGGSEVIYEIANKRDKRFVVCIYTSCAAGGVSVRGKGKDAIRVCLVADTQQGRIGVSKSQRVYRAGETSAILGRIHERARDMYRLSNQLIKSSRCQCGAPTYPDSGRCILGARCTKSSR